jgi:hypothetical protein
MMKMSTVVMMISESAPTSLMGSRNTALRYSSVGFR